MIKASVPAASTYVVILAAGKGSRMQSDIPKQFLRLKGKPVIFHSIIPFVEELPEASLILVLPPGTPEEEKKEIAGMFPGVSFLFAEGGDTRFLSVCNGLKKIENESIVLVHDSARCLVSRELIRRVYEDALKHGSAVPVVSCHDSVRLLDDTGSHPFDRERVRLVQTPQGFRSAILLPAFQCSFLPHFTDEATVVEHAGFPVFLTEGEETNIKITRPADLIRAESILNERAG